MEDQPERTEDGRYVIIRGRRWRPTDPTIPENVAATLRRELMSARRAVGAALRTKDAAAERVARDRVHRTKVALGERGQPWWEQSDDERRARWQACLPTEGRRFPSDLDPARHRGANHTGGRETP